MTLQAPSNGVLTTLAAAISSAGATSCSVASITTAGGVALAVASGSLPMTFATGEIVYVTVISGSGPYTLTIARGQEGTTATTHSSGESVALGDVTAAQLTGTFEQIANKNAANGYAGLDGSGNLVGPILIYEDVSGNLTSIVPALGQLMQSTDTHQLAVGDGVTTWGNLPSAFSYTPGTVGATNTNAGGNATPLSIPFISVLGGSGGNGTTVSAGGNAGTFPSTGIIQIQPGSGGPGATGGNSTSYGGTGGGVAYIQMIGGAGGAGGSAGFCFGGGGGIAGYIQMNGGVGGAGGSTLGNPGSSGANAGHINTSAGGSTLTAGGGAGGSISTYGGLAYSGGTYFGGAGGTINTSGASASSSANGGTGGAISTYASGSGNGGSISIYGSGTIKGGSFTLAAGTNNIVLSDASNSGFTLTLPKITSIAATQPIATSNTTSTVTFNTVGNSETQYNTSSSTITSLSITLPSTTFVGQILRYVTAGVCTTVSVTGTVSVGASLTTLAANGSVAYQAINTTGSFVRIQ